MEEGYECQEEISQAHAVEKGGFREPGGEKTEEDGGEIDADAAELDGCMKEKEIFLKKNRKCDCGRNQQHGMMSWLHSLIPFPMRRFRHSPLT